MSDKPKDPQLELPEGFLAFHNLATPKAWSEGDEPTYDITVAWPVSEYQDKQGAWPAVKRAVHAVAVAKWGERANAKRDGGPPYRVPFRFGADREKNPEQFAGYVLGTFRSKFRVPVVELHADTEPTVMAPANLTKGQRVAVLVRMRAYATSIRGVSLYAYAVAVSDTSADEGFLKATEQGDPVAEAQKQAQSHFSARRASAPKPTEKPAEADDTQAAEAGKDEPLGDGDDIPF